MNHSLKPSVLAALVLAFSSFGDAFLYIALPVNAIEMNVPVFWIGFVLSINRFARLAANQLFGYLFNRFGFKKITILATVFATLTTFTYGIATGIVFWLIVRVLWGFCYSALRISAIGYSLQSKKQGLSLGLSKGLQELGPITALLVGPILLHYTNSKTTFFILALGSVAAVFLSFYLPKLKHIPVKYSLSFNITPSSFNLLSFLSAFFVQGILIVAITKLFANVDSNLITLTATAGIYLAYRRICNVFISPFGGYFSDKFGLDTMCLISLLLTILGMFLIAIDFTKTGVLIAFTFNSVFTALAPGNAIDGTVNNLKAVVVNSTWTDIGAAIGALIAGSFLIASQLNTLFFIATFVLLTAFFLHVKSRSIKSLKLLKWK